MSTTAASFTAKTVTSMAANVKAIPSDELLIEEGFLAQISEEAILPSTIVWHGVVLRELERRKLLLLNFDRVTGA